MNDNETLPEALFDQIGLPDEDLLGPKKHMKYNQTALEFQKNLDEELSNKKPLEPVVEPQCSTKNTELISNSCSTFDCDDYPLSSFDQNIENASINHRFYGCKKKFFPSPCSESFGLPDDPIFSNSPVFLGRSRKSSLDIDLADPRDITVIDLEFINHPWLVEYPEVITPYWDIESLFPFEVDNIRHKIEPEYDSFNQSTCTFNISHYMLESSADNENDSNVVTSTPKDKSGSLSVVSTINLSNGEDNIVDIAVLKDEVLKALEEAIKNKSTIGNIDMKIQIVTSDLKSPVTSPKKSSVEVRINESVETESCKSTSSSKENYFIDNVQGNISNRKTKEKSSISISDLNKDWQDGSDINEQSQDEMEGSSENIKKSKKLRSKKRFRPGVRRSLRFSNIQSSIEKSDSTNIDSLSFSDSLFKNASSINESCAVYKPDKNNLELNNDVSFKERENQSEKRILRSSAEKSKNDELRTITFNRSNKDRCRKAIGVEKVNSLGNQEYLKGSFESQEKRKAPKPMGAGTSGKIKCIGSPLHGFEFSVQHNQQICESIDLSAIDSSANKAAPEIVNTCESKIIIQGKERKGRSRHSLKSCKRRSESSETFSSNSSQTEDEGVTKTRRKLRSSYSSQFRKNENKTDPLKETGYSCDSQSSRDEGDLSGEIVQRIRKRGRPRKRAQILDGLKEKCSSKSESSREVDRIASISKDLEDNLTSNTRVLRSGSQVPTDLIRKSNVPRRRRYSNSATEKIVGERSHLYPSSRKRSVSANFDGIYNNETSPIRRILRSQTSEQSKVLKVVAPPDIPNRRKTRMFENIKSPRISFDLCTVSKESQKNRGVEPTVKSILKNVDQLIDVQNLQLKGALSVNGDQKTIGSSSSENRVQDPEQPKLDLCVTQEADEKCLMENGITSRIKIVISPLEIKEKKEECPVLMMANEEEIPKLNKVDIPKVVTEENLESDNTRNIKVSPKKSMNTVDIPKVVIEENVESDNTRNKVSPKKSIVKGDGEGSKTFAPQKGKYDKPGLKKTDFEPGDIVWAQVGKHPFWPAIICEDPLSQTYRTKVAAKQTHIYYHIRFFGDYGRRAWVASKHIMLYHSDLDLQQMASKLKAENKPNNILKPFLVTGRSIKKWNDALEELASLKTQNYENIVKHMVESFKNRLNDKRSRKSNPGDASSERDASEADETEENPRKKQKTIDVRSERSEDFDEINLSFKSSDSYKPESSIQLPRRRNRASETFVKPSTADDSLPPKKSLENSTVDAEKAPRRRSQRRLKSQEDSNEPTSSSNVSVGAVDLRRSSEDKLADRKSLKIGSSSSSNETISGLEGSIKAGKKQADESSEADSKSTCTDSNLYSFEYQMELHKKNNLFNGLRNVKVCDYCLKTGCLFKCKGKCGGFFHIECASKVTHPRAEKQVKKARDKSPSKAKSLSVAPPVDDTAPKAAERCRTRNQCQVQIITIKSKHSIGTPKKIDLPDNFGELSLSEQIDYSMKEMMRKFENRPVYLDSTDSSSEEGSIIASKNKQLEILDSPPSSVALDTEKSTAKVSDPEESVDEDKSSDGLEVSTLLEAADKVKLIKHVTADSVILTESQASTDMNNLKCSYCQLEMDPPCFACGLEVSKLGFSARQKCSQHRCGRFYHSQCLKTWPQTQWSIGKWSRNQEPEDSFTCPAHTCHTCFSDELGSAACRLPGDKLARCMLCPAAFHATTFCVPAGTEILGGSQIVCPRHRSKPIQPINTIWCFICSAGGNLVCCDTCPTSVHPECQPISLTDDDKYICEDCESGRFPLYDEIVWVKLGQFRWWPAIILFPNEIPENVRALKHQRGDFAVKFFGTNDHYWVNKARSFLFQEGDRGGSPREGNKSKNRFYITFTKAIEDAALAYKFKKEFKLRREAESLSSLKPPAFVRINKNKPVGNVKSMELDLSNATACECDLDQPFPCGPDSTCINRLLMTECDPNICPAGKRCRNQAFQKRDYPPMIPYKTQGRGWGLKSLAPIKKGQFVIEYVGELIDTEEYQRRIQKMHEQKEENYYFMTVDSDRMIDAGPKGNLSRFMNHCCNPNCVTQKWTVRGDTRVGLFAKCDIESGSELTFNYNLEVVGQEKKVCMCGASNCSGFIGVKAKTDKPEKQQSDSVTEMSEQKKTRKYTKKRAASPPLIPHCFMCGRKQSDVTCNNKFCNKGYHITCLKLEEVPEATKFTCPRHNCNICSNRTIRCCVKCTNSFCPSHSEGNVRHDKFLGFVCRLHDPGLSSTELTPESTEVNEKPSGRSKRSKKILINSCVPEPRGVWRLYKKHQSETETLMRPNGLKNIKKSDGRRKLRNSIQNHKANGKSMKKRMENDSIKKVRVRWRDSTRRHRSKKNKVLTQSENLAIGPVNNKTSVEKQNVAASSFQIKIVQENNTEAADQENLKTDDVLLLDRPESKKSDNAIIQNNIVTSENDDISDVDKSITASYESVRSAKKRRLKADSTDESTVSSTTSDEDAAGSKSSNLPKATEKNAPENGGAEKDETVSSSPIKEPLDDRREENGSDSDEPLDRRIKRRSNSSQSRKRRKMCVKNLASTAN